MKSPYEIAKEELKDFTVFPTPNKIIRLMEIYGEQCFNTGVKKQNRIWKKSMYQLICSQQFNNLP